MQIQADFRVVIMLANTLDDVEHPVRQFSIWLVLAHTHITDTCKHTDTISVKRSYLFIDVYVFILMKLSDK